MRSPTRPRLSCRLLTLNHHVYLSFRAWFLGCNDTYSLNLCRSPSHGSRISLFLRRSLRLVFRSGLKDQDLSIRLCMSVLLTRVDELAAGTPLTVEYSAISLCDLSSSRNKRKRNSAKVRFNVFRYSKTSSIFSSGVRALSLCFLPV